ncbi:MAG TPA: AGE family epimerase/isomerase [Jatrophihabitans sp.]|jgi:mannose/cellobiose epimerase-like protein (N-acyl-D-glucosamine 2-epimerase family)|uniref:AGE family epimerase/isomerase n=1 Tax=Jatrophihabitans sp. TaxID=1932789 RepID=UPI002F14E372
MSGENPSIAGVPWAALPSHRTWLAAECDRLLDFAAGSAHPDGGFAWLDDNGLALLDKPIQTYITCRMTHVFALGQLLGRPGMGPLADHGVTALLGRLRDAEHGGWFTAVGPDGAPVEGPKRAYEHAFVVLAASSAVAAGRDGAAQLLTDALAVIEERFWIEEDGLLADEWDSEWRTLDPYRGVNANMHAVEAFLAAADVTGLSIWRERALRMVERVVHGFARSNSWSLPEHFDTSWQALPAYNTEDRSHQFRPYGVTIGHLMEWARLALHLRAALGPAAPEWLLPDAESLFRAGVRLGWAVDGAAGFVYTVDWDGAPVVRNRLHWVLAEAIAAAAALGRVTGDPEYERWYRLWWDHAAALFLDPVGGSWRHELDFQNRPAATVWSGKPDVYHALQTTIVPLLPLAPTFATALARGLPAEDYVDERTREG